MKGRMEEVIKEGGGCWSRGGGRSYPILTKWQVKSHTFDLVLPLRQSV